VRRFAIVGDLSPYLSPYLSELEIDVSSCLQFLPFLG
jgi:hypothetical protein